ncbi:MAG: FKBP-type peptidyl-prolyl cis-trans isomerase [archaeon]|nr:FKBP-type peptidyl-prolyl cis-trans isomerase [archaeon]
MKEKSCILIEFTGKVSESGKIFDTTDEKTAKEAGLYKEQAVFKPVPVIIGNGDVLKGLDIALREMSEGESKNIKLSPEKAFGQRQKELIVVIPVKQFTERKIKPFPGLIVDLNGQYGRVQTVSGGRVRVDLNNDLAGKDVEYSVKIIKEIKTTKEKAEVLTEKYFPMKDKKVETKLEENILKVKFPKELASQIGALLVPFTKTIKEAIPEIKSVEFVESFEGKTVKEKESKSGTHTHTHADGTVHHHEH